MFSVVDKLFEADRDQRCFQALTMAPLKTSDQKASSTKGGESSKAMMARTDAYSAAIKHHTERDAARPSSDIVELTPVPRAESLENIIKFIYKEMSGKNNLSVLGDKLPNFHNFDGENTLSKYNITPKFIVVIRNPIDVINSSVHRKNNSELGNDTWHITTVDEAIEEWIENWNYAQKHVDSTDHLFVKYEDLAKNFSVESKRISEFLQVEEQFTNLMSALPEHARLYALEPEEVTRLRAMFDGVLALWDSQDIRAILKACPQIYRTVRDGEIVPLSSAARSHLGLEGFGQPEHGWRWTCAQTARIAFRVEGAVDGTEIWVDLEFAPYFGPRDHFAFMVTLGDGQRFLEHVYATDHMPARRGYIAKARDGCIDIELLMPVRKTENDEPNDDLRELGLALRSVQARILNA
jgi:hypothetical protein